METTQVSVDGWKHKQSVEYAYVGTCFSVEENSAICDNMNETTMGHNAECCKSATER